jgi:hypothetical protein
LIGTKAASLASHSATGASATTLHQAELAKLQAEAKALGQSQPLGTLKATENVGRHVVENLSEPGIDPQYTSKVEAKPEVQAGIRRDFAPGQAPGQPPVRFLPIPTAAGALIGADAAMGNSGAAGDANESLERVIRYRPDYKEFNEEIDDLINPTGVIFGVTVWTVILSACIFIAILTWLEFIRVFYDTVFDPLIPERRNWLSVWTRFSYAFFITALMIVLVYIIFRFSKEYEQRHRRIPY